MHPQIPLALTLAPSRTFDSYHAGPQGAPMLQSVQRLCGAAIEFAESPGSETPHKAGAAERQVYLWGEGVCGKTHLLSAACQMASQAGRRVAFLPLNRVCEAGLFEALECAGLVCIDNLQCLTVDAESALFHAMNRCRATGTPVLLSADLPPHELPVELPDLRTRLEWGLVFHLPVPNEALVRAALARQLGARGLAVPDKVLDFLLRRLPRDLPTLMRWVEVLDQAALSHQRRLTVPLVSQLLRDLPHPPGQLDPDTVSDGKTDAGQARSGLCIADKPDTESCS